MIYGVRGEALNRLCDGYGIQRRWRESDEQLIARVSQALKWGILQSVTESIPVGVELVGVVVGGGGLKRWSSYAARFCVWLLRKAGYEVIRHD